MRPSLAKALIESRTDGVGLLYGVATGDNTVQVAGSTVAVELPALSPVVSGDYCAILAAGADRLILGPVGGTVARGSFSGTTNVGSSLAVTHGLDWTPTYVGIMPLTPNGASITDRFTGWNVSAITSTTFTIGRCVSQDGSLLASTAVAGRWVAVR